jgi:hypothetical protein
MKHDEATAQPAPLGQVERGVRPLAQRLASQLQNAAYNCGYEDAHPANATTRQAKADAKARETLAALHAEIERLQAGHDRYETARRMNPRQWADAWKLNISTGKPFDEVVDDLRPFLRPNVRGKLRAEAKP